MWKAYQEDVIEAHKTDDLSDSQPTKGNIAGGLTTIEEKALGKLEKIGRECRYIDALQPAEAPAKGPGLYYMDTSSAAAECVTLMAAAGYVIHTFPTGQGNVIGNPIVPVIKISGNPKTLRTMGEHIDVDVTGVLRRDMTLDAAGDALIDMVVRTANGRLTAAESLGHREFVMTKLYGARDPIAPLPASGGERGRTLQPPERHGRHPHDPGRRDVGERGPRPGEHRAGQCPARRLRPGAGRGGWLEGPRALAGAELRGAGQGRQGRRPRDPHPRQPRPAVAAIDAASGFAYPGPGARPRRAARHGAGERPRRRAAIRRSHHCGAAGLFVEDLASRGLVALLFANTPAAIAPWNGKRAVFGTNPIAFACPLPGREPVVVDLSLSKVARGNIVSAKQRGEPIPEGWAVDARAARPPTPPPRSRARCCRSATPRARRSP